MTTQNQRRHIRYSVRHTAWLQLSQSGDIPVLINNHSPGGVYVTMVDRTQPADHPIARRLKAGDPVTIGIQMSIDKTIEQYPGRIIRASQLGFAIAFDDLHDQLSAELNRIAEHQGFDSRQAQLQIDEEERHQLIDKISRRTTGFFSRYLGEAFEDIKHRMLDAASDSRDPSKQTPYFDALSTLHNHQASILETFLADMTRHFSHFNHVKSAQQQDQQDQDKLLALVDDEQFETWLSFSEFISAIHNRNHQTLMELETRLGIVAGQTIESSNNPLDPMVFHHYLTQALSHHQFGHDANQLIWKTFSSHLNKHIGSLYKGINGTLAEAAILPNIVLTPHQVSQRRAAPSASDSSRADRSEASAEVAQSAVELPASNAAQATAGGMASAERPRIPPDATARVIDLLELLRQGTQGATGDDGAAAEAEPTGPELPLNDLNAALTDLQVIDPEQPEGSLRQRIDLALSKRFGSQESMRIQREHEQIISVAEQLVDTIANDDALDDLSRKWIGQLDVQLLKVLLDQQPLFTDEHNAARAVVDNLGDSSFDSIDDLSPNDQRLISQISDIVERLKHLDTPDQSLFSESADRLNTLLSRQRRQRVTQLRRVIDMCEGQQRLSKARKQVHQSLDQRFTGREIPELIDQLLNLGWRELMDLAIVRNDDDGEYQSLLSVIDELDEHLGQDSAGKLMSDADRTDLLERIRGRLHDNNIAPKQCAHLIEDLNDALNAPDAGVPRMAYEPALKDEGSEQDQHLTREQNHWLGVAKSIDVNMWLMYPDASDQPRPIRLAWVSEDRSQHVFVNRNGRKVLERSLTELAHDFEVERAVIIDSQDQSLVDRSWHGMVNKLHGQIAHQATHDELTGTYNRKEFSRLLRLKIGESKLMHTVHTAVLVNLDHFRVINNIYGQETGDQLLQDVSRSIEKQVGEQAVVARLNADEFAVLMPTMDLKQGEQTADSIRQAIANIHNRRKNNNLKVTASLGLTQVDRNSDSLGTVLNQLETSLRTAKQNGRDQIIVSGSGKNDQKVLDETEAWVLEIDEVLEQNRIELFGQQIKSLTSEEGTRRQYEILCRMRDSKGDMIPPDKFISVAEAYGRIHFLDEWVVAHALRLLESSPIKQQISRLAINISGKTINRPGFVPYIKQQFEKVDVPPSRICFEITETAAISNLSQCSDFLKELKKIGCRFSLDDFGTGLSSFSYLKFLPVDYIKIDGSFIKEVTTSSADLGLVKTINEIAHYMGKETIAEHVESEAVIEIMNTLEIDYIQGSAIHDPTPLTELLQLNDS